MKTLRHRFSVLAASAAMLAPVPALGAPSFNRAGMATARGLIALVGVVTAAAAAGLPI